MALRTRLIALGLAASALSIARGTIAEATPWGPSPSLSLNFLSGVVDPRVDFTRTSPGGYFDSTGTFQWTPTSRNLLLYTREFDNAIWNKAAGSVTVAPDAAIGWDGFQTADTITESTGTGAHNIYQSAPVASGQAHTWSGEAKANGRSSIQLKCQATATIYTVEFDLSAGTKTDRFGIGSATITSLGNGWYRITATATSTAAGTGYWQLNLCNAANSTSYTGDGVSGVHLRDAQFEQAAVASSYTRNYGGFYPPRLDYDPITLQPRGLLGEEVRANRTLQSEDFTLAPWAAAVTGTSTRVNAGLYKGFMRGLVTATSANGGIRQIHSGLTSGKAHAVSFYLDGATPVLYVLENGSAAYGQPCSATLNPANGTSSALTGITGVTSVPFGAGYIFTVILPVAAGTLTANQEIRCPNSGESFGFGRPQFEEGAFATSYMPTGAAIVTRAVDTGLIQGATFASFFNQTEGTIFVEFDCYANAAIAVYEALTISDGTSSNMIRIFEYNGAIGGAVTTGAVSQADMQQAGAYTPNAPVKVALAYKANDFAVSVNGNVVITDTAGAVPVVDRMYIGGMNTRLNGHVRKVAAYPVRLSNAQLQALTA